MCMKFVESDSGGGSTSWSTCWRVVPCVRCVELDDMYVDGFHSRTVTFKFQFRGFVKSLKAEVQVQVPGEFQPRSAVTFVEVANGCQAALLPPAGTAYTGSDQERPGPGNLSAVPTPKVSSGQLPRRARFTPPPSAPLADGPFTLVQTPSWPRLGICRTSANNKPCRAQGFDFRTASIHSRVSHWRTYQWRYRVKFTYLFFPHSSVPLDNNNTVSSSLPTSSTSFWTKPVNIIELKV